MNEQIQKFDVQQKTNNQTQFFFGPNSTYKLGKSCPPTLLKRGCQGASQCGTNKSTHHKAALKGKHITDADQLQSLSVSVDPSIGVTVSILYTYTAACESNIQVAGAYII